MKCLRSRASEFWSFRVLENQRIRGSEDQRSRGLENWRIRVDQSLLEVGDGAEIHTMEDGQSWGSGLGVP